MSETDRAWPELPLEAWEDTRATLHMWTQIVGKIRMAQTPLLNHWWNVTLYVTARGLTTSPIPHGSRVFEMRFDFIDHVLLIETSDGVVKIIRLAPRSVADFYQEVMATLHSIGIDVLIHARPDEVPNRISFAEDHGHKSYDPELAQRFWRILVSVDGVFKDFRSRFIGKCSPVHFFWGSFDLPVTRFSGRPPPERPGADGITREGYSHECSSAGFWPGSGEIKGPAFFAYAAPEPADFKTQRGRPEGAFYHPGIALFVLMYDDFRTTESPRDVLMEFLQSTSEAAANLGNWDRPALERS